MDFLDDIEDYNAAMDNAYNFVTKRITLDDIFEEADLTGNVNATSGISSFRKIGINTTVPTESVDLDCLQANATFKRVGIGSTQPDGVLDVSGGLSQASKRFIMLPKVSAGSTAVIQADSPEGGGLIYNTTLRKLQFFNGTNWETVTSVEVTG